LTVCSKRQIDGEDFVNFRGLLRKYERYSVASKQVGYFFQIFVTFSEKLEFKDFMFFGNAMLIFVLFFHFLSLLF